jgi:hypothetical protein
MRDASYTLPPPPLLGMFEGVIVTADENELDGWVLGCAAGDFKRKPVLMISYSNCTFSRKLME